MGIVDTLWLLNFVILKDGFLQQTNGQGSCGTYTPWNITQPLKRIHLNQF